MSNTIDGASQEPSFELDLQLLAEFRRLSPSQRSFVLRVARRMVETGEGPDEAAAILRNRTYLTVTGRAS
jgi:hypothetical protein